MTDSRPDDPPASPLQFRPLSEGLGFHPFSDGLPYAPVSRVGGVLPRTPRAPPPSGAVAAGRPSFVRNPARISVPVARSPVRTVAPPVSQPIKSPLPVITPPHYGFGYLLKRVVAYGVDSGLNYTLCLGALAVALWRQNLDPRLLLNPSIALLAVMFLFVFNTSVIAAQEIVFQTTLGKRLLGLSVQGTASALFLRAFFFIPSLLFCGAGLFWALFDSQRRCWHDLVVDVQPTEFSRL